MRVRRNLLRVLEADRRFIPSDDSQLMPIRQLELFATARRSRTDTSMAADEKAKRLKTSTRSWPN
jgi:hypothetical protein